jgi:hypothetical protein
MAGRAWTKREDRRLIALSRDRPVADVAMRLGRSVRACYCRLYVLGRPLGRKAGFQPGQHANPTGEFKPGQMPWNKGLKGIHLSPATEFKPGHLRGMAARRLCCVGWVTVRCHRGVRTRWIKFTNSGPPQYHWMPMARWIWINRCGPIPRGRLIIHLNGDSLDDRPENLAMVNRVGHLRRQVLRDPTIKDRRREAAAQALRERWRWARLVKSGKAELAAEPADDQTPIRRLA